MTTPTLFKCITCCDACCTVGSEIPRQTALDLLYRTLKTFSLYYF